MEPSDPNSPTAAADSAQRALAKVGHLDSGDSATAVADALHRTVLAHFGLPALARSGDEIRRWARTLSPLALRHRDRAIAAGTYDSVDRARLHSLTTGRFNVLERLAGARSRDPGMSAELLDIDGEELVIRVDPILSSRAARDVRVSFTIARPTWDDSIRPDEATPTTKDSVLGTVGQTVRVAIPAHAPGTDDPLQVVVHVIDESGRLTQSSVCVPEGFRAPRMRSGSRLSAIEADAAGELRIRTRRTARGALRALLRRRDTAQTRPERDDRPAPALRVGRSANRSGRQDVLRTHRHAAVTWSIPQNFGGMTTVLLRRSRMLAQRTADPVDILVLSPDFDPTEWKERLRARGLLVDTMRLRGLWTELADMSAAELRALVPGGPEAAPDPRVDAPVAEVRADDAESVERRRPDGTLLAVDQRTEGRLELLLVDRSGRVATIVHRRRRELYLPWIARALGEEPAVLLTDSKPIAGYLHTLERPDTVVGQVFHSTHLNAYAPTLFGPMNPYHLRMIENADAYDLTVILTDRQREDIDAVTDAGTTLVTVPNSLDTTGAGEAVARTTRRPDAGVVVSRLDADKRLDHAIRAVARSSGDWDLTIYGSGAEEQALSYLIDGLGLSTRVRLAGFDPSIPERLAEASFLVVSSRFEGMSLVIIEAMAAGCIPITYDIRYGMSDVITHGVDGLLVPDGDEDALARTIDGFLRLDSVQVRHMREAAQSRARDFDSEVIAERWVEVLADAVDRAQQTPRQPADRVRLTDVHARFDGSVLHLRARMDDGALTGSGYAIDAVARKDVPYLFSRKAARSPGTADVAEVIADLPADAFAAPTGTVYDLYLRAQGAPASARVRVPAPASLGSADHSRRGLRMYATVKGNLSVEVVSAGERDG